MASITISAPATGASLVKGTTTNITWSVSDIADGTDMTLQLRLNGSYDSNLTSTIHSEDGSYTWLVPTDLTTSNNYTLRIFRTGNFTPTAETGNFRIGGVIESASDSTSFSESVSTSETTWAEIESPTDSVGFTESLSGNTTSDKTKWIIAETPSDSTSLSESVSTTTSKWSQIFSPADSMSLTEALDIIHNVGETPTDSISFTEAITTATKVWSHIVEDDVSFTEDVTSELGRSSRLFQLDAGGTNESLEMSRATGWITISPLDKNFMIRDINLGYKSSDIINIKMYKDDDLTTTIFNKDFAASSSKTLANARVGQRAKILMINISTTSTTNSDTEIDMLQIGVDDSYIK